MKLEGANLVINMYDLLGQLPSETRGQLIDSLACLEEVIDEVMNQVLEGYTSEGSHGPRTFGGNPDATRGIDGARMRIAKASSEIAAKEIEALARQIKSEKELGQKGWDAYHELLRRGR